RGHRRRGGARWGGGGHGRDPTPACRAAAIGSRRVSDGWRQAPPPAPRGLGAAGYNRSLTPMRDTLAAGELLPLSADWFRALAETTATAIFVYDVDHLLYVNRAAEELTGYDAEALTKLGVDELIAPEHRAAARASRVRRLG